MKVAVIGSRGLYVPNLADYLPPETTEIVSGGARGVDSSAAQYARAQGLKLTEFRPNYDAYGKGAPLVRNREIVNYADLVLAFWDGKSKGTVYVIRQCQKTGTPIKVFRVTE